MYASHMHSVSMTILGPHTLQQCFSLLLAADGSLLVGWMVHQQPIQDPAPPAAEAGGGLEHNVFSGVWVCLCAINDNLVEGI